MKRRAKNILINIGLVFVSLACMSMLTEAAFRFFNPQTSRSFQFDPVIGYRREPGLFISNVGNKYAVQKHVNSAGFMDREWNKIKPEGVTRIVVLGDSMTEAIQVENGADFQSILEKKLIQRGNKVEVLNFGLSGQNTAQEYLTLKEYALAYRPDIAIIVSTITNDTFENHPKLNGRAYVPYILFDGENEQFQPPIDPSYGFVIDYLRSHSHLVRWAMSRAYDIRQYMQGLSSDTSQKNNQTIPVFFQNFLKERDTAWDEAWIINQKLFEHMKKFTDQNHIPLIAVVIPDQTQIYDSEWEAKFNKAKLEFPKLATVDNSSIDHEDPNRRYDAIFNNAKILHIDFLELFRARHNEQLYAQNDVHLNEHGHEYVAETIKAFLIENDVGDLR